MGFLRNKSVQTFASGFPQTSVVFARRIRGAGNTFFRRGPVVLTNGSNAFVVDPTPYKQIKVQSAEAGVFQVVGLKSVGSETFDALASFGSEEAANNGYAALMRAHAGVKVAGAKTSSRLAALKWPVGLTALFLFVALFGAFGSDDTVAATNGMPQLSAQDLADAQKMAYAEVAKMNGLPAAGFNRKEPSLDELANGNYTFEPKLKAPEVQVPTLNCAQK